MSTAILTVEDVSVRFSGVLALDRLTLSIHPGETVALIGPNGAGKTTLLNAISGLLPLAGGTIRFGAQPIGARRAHLLPKAGLARTFQHAQLVEELSVLENVMVGATAKRSFGSLLSESIGLPGSRRQVREETERAESLLDSFGLTHVRDVEAGNLPFGQKKLVDLVRSLMRQPNLLLLDEPTAGLNEAEVESLSGYLADLATRMSILVVAHHMGFVTSVSNRVLCLNSGRKIAEGTADEVQADPAVITAYLGAEWN